jgi:hypothetical protein
MSKTAKQSHVTSDAATETTRGSSKQDISGSEMMQAVLSRPRNTKEHERQEPQRINGVVIGELATPLGDGQTMVVYPGCPSGEPLAALSTELMDDNQAGRPVALSFVEGDPERPIILGLIQQAQSIPEQESARQPGAEDNTDNQKVNVSLDGETMTLSADKEIVLKCGKSSITLTRAGKIILKGTYLSNHSTGVNRIKGGSVQIN